MARLLRIPEVATGSTDAVLTTWSLAENVPYQAADVIATLETAKAVVDIEADEDGVILRRLVGEGTNVEAGQPIAVIGQPGELAADIEELLRTQTGAGAAGSAGIPASPAVATPAGNPAATGAPGSAGGLIPSGDPEPASAAANGGNGVDPRRGLQEAARIFISPLARRLARDGGLDLQAITGTGPGGRIMRRDVEEALRAVSTESVAHVGEASPTPAAALAPSAAPVPSAQAAAAPAPAPAGAEEAARYTAVPHTRVRQAIASRLAESKQSVPHFYVSGSLRADRLLRLRAELNDGSSAARVSVNDLVIKAVARAHQLVPAMNVIWTPDALHSFDSVDIGVAIASPRGLVSPVVRSVERQSISALAATVADVIERARIGRLQQRELDGGTTCVTNLGMFGVEQFSAIINPPQSSILAVGAVHDAPVVKHGKLRVGKSMCVTLSADHRAVDGTTAAEWMRAFVALVEHPAQILA
jgi:pyruvate dehydrogenase E2 component (dihydrolipoamide acetyltransferase)